MAERIYMVLIQRDLSDGATEELQRHIRATSIFAAANTLKEKYENSSRRVVVIEEVNFADDEEV